MSQNGPKTTSLMTSLTKNPQPPTKNGFSSADWKTGRSISALEQLSSGISGGALARKPTTAGFRPISKYKYIVPQLSTC